MKITSLVKARLPATGAEITVRDHLGRTKTLEISPQAELQMIEALLCGQPSKIGTPYQRRPFAVSNLTMHMTSAGELVIEFFLTDKASILIGLEEPLPKRLQELLGQDPKTWQGGSTH